MATAPPPLNLRNKAMQRKLEERRAIDLAPCARTATGVYVLEKFVEGLDYCDSSREAWVWSIAKLTRPLPSVMADGSRRTLGPGLYLAAMDSRFYHAGHPASAYDCVFLR